MAVVHLLKNKTAAVVVLYNPEVDVYSNIESYINHVDCVFAVDNSDVKNEQFIDGLKEYDSVRYIDNQGNKGIASALHTGVVKAAKEGYHWALTMDQDSRFKEGVLSEMYTFIEQEGSSETLGIVSPFHADIVFPEPETMDPVPRTEVMTSGNLLNIEVYQKIGPFREDYFIDMVDHEYCLRLWSNNYRVMMVNRAKLHHQLGSTDRLRFFGMNFTRTNHSGLRKYYFIRNYFTMRKEYVAGFHDHFKVQDWILIKIILKTLILEKKRFLKLKMMLKGYIDYRSSKLGKFVPKS